MMVGSNGNPFLFGGAESGRAPERGAGSGRRPAPGGGTEAGATPFAALLMGMARPVEAAPSEAKPAVVPSETPAEAADGAVLEAEAADPAVLLTDGVDDIAPELERRLARVVRRMEELGHSVKIVEGFRTQARQESLWRQGRSSPGPKVTWTRNSLHTQGRAVDVQVNGGWTDLDGYRALQRIAREEGLSTLGMRDPGHLELPDHVASGAATEKAAGFPGARPAPVGRPEPVRRPEPVWARPESVGPAGSTGAETRVATPAPVARPAAVAEPAAVAPVARPARVPRPGDVVSRTEEGQDADGSAGRASEATGAAALSTLAGRGQAVAGSTPVAAEAADRGTAAPDRSWTAASRTMAPTPGPASGGEAAARAADSASDPQAPALTARGAETLALGESARIRVRGRMAGGPANGAEPSSDAEASTPSGEPASRTSSGEAGEATRNGASRVAAAVHRARATSGDWPAGPARDDGGRNASSERRAPSERSLVADPAPAAPEQETGAATPGAEGEPADDGATRFARLGDQGATGRSPADASSTAPGMREAGDRAPLPGAPGAGADGVEASTAPDRAAQVREIQARARAAGGPLRVELSDLDGEGTNVRMRVRGSRLDTTVEFQDADLTHRARTRVDELHRSLERAGFDPESVVLRSQDPGSAHDRNGRGRGESQDTPFQQQQQRDGRSRRDRRDESPTPFPSFHITEEER